MPRETALEKGLRYVSSGRLLVERIDERVVEARCRGDRGTVYRLGYRPGQWWCECPVRTAECSHLYALWCGRREARSCAVTGPLAEAQDALDAARRTRTVAPRTVAPPNLFAAPGRPVEPGELTTAITAAEDHETNEWRQLALDAVRATAERLDELTIDDVRPRLPELPHLDERALGGIMRRASRAGWIHSTHTYRPSTRPETHRRPLLIWRSRLRGAL